MSEMTVNARRKAAALILAIGPTRAGHLLQHLNEEEVRLLAEEVARLSQVDSDEQDVIFQETLSQATRRRTLGGGVDVAKALLAKYGGADLKLDGGPKVFETVSELPASRIAQLLKDEHPQVVTVVLADLAADRAADVLANFAEELRNDISFRIATLADPHPDAVAVIEETLALHSAEGQAGRSLSLDGAKGLAEILNAAGRDSEEEILEYVDSLDQETAERIRALMFVFEDIGGLDDRAIQAILKNIDNSTLSYALKGVSDGTRNKILGNLSERARNSLLEEMDLMGGVRKSEVEAAQQQVIAQLRILEESGEVVLARGGSDELIA